MKRMGLYRIASMLMVGIVLFVAGCTPVEAPAAMAPEAAPTAAVTVEPEAAVATEDGLTQGYDLAFSEKHMNTQVDEATATTIELTGDGAQIEGEGAVYVEGGLRISSPGDYVLSGNLEEGRIVVGVDVNQPVHLVLNGVNVHCSTSAPLNIANGEAIITLADGSTNTFTDGTPYVYPEPSVKEPNACLFADDDLCINGNGTLIVRSSYNNGIGSKDNLRILGGNIQVKAINNALKGNDSVVIGGGTISIECEDDGIKSDNETEAGKGYVAILAGKVDVVAGDDTIQATKAVFLTDATVTVRAGGKDVNCSGQVQIAAGSLFSQQ